MNYLNKPFLVLGLLVASFSSATSASAGTYDHIDLLALHIEKQARLLVSESRHYQYTPEYREIVSDTQSMCRLTAHIHALARNHGSVAHLESDVRELDARFHHLEELFDRVERNARYGRGYIHGNTSHVKRLLDSIEDDIHHLKDDLRSLRSPHHTVRRYPTQPATVYRSTPAVRWGGYSTLPQSGFPAYGSYGRSSHGHSPYSRSNRGYNGGRTITFGGGSSRFTFRF